MTRKTARMANTTVILLVAAMIAPIIMMMSPTAVFAEPKDGSAPGHSGGHGTPRENPGAPPDPDCWGEVTKQLVEFDDGQHGIGDHASRFGEPRDGVGNQDEDTPSEHGEVVGDMIDIHCIED